MPSKLLGVEFVRLTNHRTWLVNGGNAGPPAGIQGEPVSRAALRVKPGLSQKLWRHPLFLTRCMR